MKTILSTFVVLCFACTYLSAQEEAAPSIWDQVQWEVGPTSSSIGNMAEIDVPEGYIFAGAKDTQMLMEYMENPISGEELGFFSPEDVSWFLVFEFSDTGYIKDDEKDSLDADAMLKSMKAATEATNKLRQERGWAPLYIDGWEKEPFYNAATNNLEWATRLSDGQTPGSTVNYNTRILGRSGVMRVTLVCDPEQLPVILSDYQTTLAGFDYKSGSRYADWIEGDKIAEYGLTGLVVGAGAAVAAKTGLLAKFWKFLLIPIIAVGALFKKFFGKNG